VLVMGTHGHSGLRRVVVGSVAADVLRRATTPLIIVPSRPTKDAPEK
jgi:nucleotide-binding universal stress UspA family protein